MIKPLLTWQQPLNDKTKTRFKQTLHELCHYVSPMKAEAYLRGFQVNRRPRSRHVTPHPSLMGPEQRQIP